jgi:hypothetical protein
MNASDQPLRHSEVSPLDEQCESQSAFEAEYWDVISIERALESMKKSARDAAVLPSQVSTSQAKASPDPLIWNADGAARAQSV